MDRKLARHIEGLIERLRVYPSEAWRDLYEALSAIERRYRLEEKLTEEDLRAIEEGLAELERGEYVTHEQLIKELGLDRIGTAALEQLGKEELEDALSRVRKLSGEKQGDVAGVIFALLNQYRYDTLPPKG